MAVINTVSDLLNQMSPPAKALQEAVDLFLSQADDAMGAMEHVGIIYSSAISSSRQRFGSYAAVPLEVLSNWMGSIAGFGTKGNVSGTALLQALNKIMQLTTDCNLAGISIQAAKLSVNRAVQVSSDTLIRQAHKQREMYTKSATPQLRQWNIEGYLTADANIDTYYFVKPTVLIQIDTLDAMAISRRPVWFKDNNNRFFQVQITNFNQDYTPESQNAVHVVLTLQEWKPIDTDIPQPVTNANSVPKEEAA